MEYLHESSFPVTKSELEIFTVPPTQTAIEASYEVEYRPSASLENGSTYEIHVPSSDDFTDLQATMLHIVASVVTSNNGRILEDKVQTVENFGNSLFEQIDLFLGTINTSQANNLYHYQSWFEDTFFRAPNKVDGGRMDGKEKNRILNQEFDLYFRIHLPLCEQDKLMLNNMPMTFRFTRSSESFPLIRVDDKDETSYKVKINSMSLHIKRIKLFPDTQLSLLNALQKSPAKYFITRNETRIFAIGNNMTAATVDNLFSGILPRRVIIGFVDEQSHTGTLDHNPYEFKSFNTNFIALYVDGNMIPSIPYTPNFQNKIYMREFVDLYRFFNQDEGHPQLDLSYEDYGKGKTLFAFDLSPDNSIGAENGTLSLVKRGVIRMSVKFSKTLTTPVKVVVFGQFDNLITVDRDRAVVLDY